MESTNLNIRIDKNVKQSAEKIFDDLGLNMTTAINIFLRQVVREKGIPFDVKLKVPNEVTLAAFEEGKKLLNDSSAPSFNNLEDLKTALEL